MSHPVKFVRVNSKNQEKTANKCGNVLVPNEGLIIIILHINNNK